jgi:diguanylate cyclase (GGDEF)-like protein/PAS domain S-box-containing protein
MAEALTSAATYPIPPNEEERLHELHALDLIGGDPIDQIDRICQLARDLYNVPVALVPLVDRDRLAFLALSGIELPPLLERGETFCAHAILDDGPMIVEDASKDPRFANSPFVKGAPHVRFYAGVPLRLKSGVNLGTLSIVDFVPRKFSKDRLAHLVALSDIIVSEICGRHAARELKAREKRLAQIARMAKFGGYEWNIATDEVVWDGEIHSIYGLPPEIRPNHDMLLRTYDKETREKSRLRVDALFQKGEPYDVEVQGTRPNGETFWIRTMAEAEMVDGKVARVFGAIRDVTDRKLAEIQIHDLAYRDALTGLPNRLSFLEKINGAIAAARETGGRVDLIMFNIDHFRDINDALGHQVGDRLLRKVANALLQNFNAIGSVARIGGDEFAAVVLGQQTSDHARQLAEDFSAQIRQLMRQDNYALPLSASGGLAVFPDHGDVVETVMKNAKVALRDAKAHGRGNLVLFDPSMRKAADEKNALVQRIWTGIDNKEFTLHYQPIVALRASKVTGLEALMRWNHPERGVLAPSYFMVAFDEPDLAVALGDLGLEIAIGQMRQWIDEGVDFGSIAVNLSTAQFRLGDLAENILTKLHKYGVPPKHLTLEVTENVYMDWGADVVAATVRKLHNAGVGIALDDFGTGYASLSHLCQFPIDKLKIDKSFVQSAESAAIVDAVINMGLSLGMQVVAEGVEEPEQVDLLRLKGCDFVQGYVFAKPMPANEATTYIAEFSQDLKPSIRLRA